MRPCRRVGAAHNRWRAAATGLALLLLLPSSALAGTAHLLCTGEEGHAVVEAGGYAAHWHHDGEPDEHLPVSAAPDSLPEEHSCEHEEISVDGLRRAGSALGGPARGTSPQCWRSWSPGT